MPDSVGRLPQGGIHPPPNVFRAVNTVECNSRGIIKVPLDASPSVTLTEQFGALTITSCEQHLASDSAWCAGNLASWTTGRRSIRACAAFALLHAMLYKKGPKPWCQWQKGANPCGDRYEHVGADPKHWDRSMCLRQHLGSENPPERTPVASGP